MKRHDVAVIGVGIADQLIERAARVFPPTRNLRLVDSRIGVRPMPADGQTIAGRIPGLANAWMIATHSGVTLGPLLGRLIADEIVSGTPSGMLAPFRPERFLATGAQAGESNDTLDVARQRR